MKKKGFSDFLDSILEMDSGFLFSWDSKIEENQENQRCQLDQRSELNEAWKVRLVKNWYEAPNPDQPCHELILINLETIHIQGQKLADFSHEVLKS